jgi:hypothetical protein
MSYKIQGRSVDLVWTEEEVDRDTTLDKFLSDVVNDQIKENQLKTTVAPDPQFSLESDVRVNYILPFRPGAWGRTNDF